MERKQDEINVQVNQMKVIKCCFSQWVVHGVGRDNNRFGSTFSFAKLFAWAFINVNNLLNKEKHTYLCIPHKWIYLYRKTL